MDRRKFLFSLAACPACASAAMAESAAPHWEYEGERGVAKWGELDSRFKACAVGSEQSPIDLTRGIRAKVEDLSFNWKPQAFDVINNGHTIQANVQDGSALAIGKTTYGLKQFPSIHPASMRSAASAPRWKRISCMRRAMDAWPWSACS